MHTSKLIHMVIKYLHLLVENFTHKIKNTKHEKCIAAHIEIVRLLYNSLANAA